MNMHTLIAAAIVTMAGTSAAVAQDVQRTPLPPQHPLVGSWRIDVPGTQCHEIYNIKADGTTSVTSGAQAAESEFQIDRVPSPKGYYKWVDKIVKENGQPDCMGETMQVGHVATNYIILHPSRPEFLMCEAERLDSCIGPFRKQGMGI